MHLPRSRTFVPLVLALAVAGAACGDDTPTTDATTPAGASEPGSEPGSEPAGSEPAGDAVTITAVDFEFQNVPESVPAGTRLALSNESTAEVHELIAVRFPDDETRPIDEIAALPEAELDAIFGEGPPALVLVAAPGSDQPGAVHGDGTIAEAGRYALVCFIPVGADPEEILNQDGPPPSEDSEAPSGPPHFAEGMYAQLIVE